MLKVKKYHKKIFFLIWLIFILLLFLGAKKICDRYCFDSFIYRKNNTLAELFGYKEENSNLCKAQLNSDGFREEELYSKKDGEYLVIVVGDSVVYGQGLLKNQRFTEKLEKKLNKTRPTRVLNLGICGTNIYQHYQLAIKYRQRLNPDLTIIGFTENDLLVWDSIANYPMHLPTEGIVLGIEDGNDDDYIKSVLSTFEEGSPNMQMAEYVASLLFKERVTIFSFAYLDLDKQYNAKLGNVLALFRSNGLKVLDSKHLFKDKYRDISLKRDGRKFMSISEVEKHPNSLANKMFAESLFDEIVSNPSYSFSE